MSNSNQAQNQSVGGTLTGGIQDVSAILPIIGTDQCETHVGSALSGGYLYAASAVLSIFGSLGIVKAGVAVLISSVSIPNFWVSGRDLRPSGPKGKVKQSMFLGARMLADAGFKLQGDVAPLIGMDGRRFKAETKLIQILEEKHIDNPENVSINWKSKEWNTMLVLSTILTAAMSGIPYFALLLGPASWRPTTNLPWLFPFLRTVSSCLASVCCQFLIQSRVISVMKSRVLFMVMHHRFVNALSKDNKVDLEAWLKYHLQWDSDLPAEQCIRNLQQFLSSCDDISKLGDDVQPTQGHVSIDMAPEKPPSTRWTHWRYRVSSAPQPHSPPPKPLFAPDTVRHTWYMQYYIDHSFLFPIRDRAFTFIIWVVLCLSLPATVAGYVGCFTLVGATPSKGNGPLVWLGLEVALSVIRILIWAWNPKFDEDTDITVELKLANHQLFLWTEELNGFIHYLENEKSMPLSLLSERQFLGIATAYSGPLDQFQRSENIALYFTVMADDSIRTEDIGTDYLSLLITVFDFNTRLSVTLLQLGEFFYYFDADVKHEAKFSEINARLLSTMRNIYPWQAQARIFFTSLEQHYTSLVQALNRTRKVGENVATLESKWDLSSLKPRLTTSPSLPPQSPGDDSYPPYSHQNYEHGLKTNLVELWRRWIVHGMEDRIEDARKDCYQVLEEETRPGPFSERVKWELTELNRLVAWEWALREKALITCSLELEDILRAKMEKGITQFWMEQDHGQLVVRMRTRFEISRRKRLENERGEAIKIMKAEMNSARGLAERMTRSWRGQGRFAPSWQEGITFIDTLWSEGINKGPTALVNAELEINNLARIDIPFDVEDTTRDDFVGQVKQRFAHWHSQREYERHEMEATIERIRSVDSSREQLDSAYEHPWPDNQAPLKFVYLPVSSSDGKACSAIVYDADVCSATAVCNVVKKITTRSVVRVDPKVVASIPENDHLLFLSCAGEGEEPDFVQHNRNRWWDRQTTNSALFYFTPEGVRINDSCYVKSGPIAQIFIFLTTSSHIRLHLLHCAIGRYLLSIEQNGKSLYTLSDGIPKSDFKLQGLELGELAQGRHELRVVVSRIPQEGYNYDNYYLRDIVIEILDNPGQNSSALEDSDESGKSAESPTFLDSQNSGLKDHTDTQILNEGRDL